MKKASFKFLLPLLVAGISFGTSYAQTFKVLGAKGAVTVDGAPVKVGGPVDAKQSIVIPDGGYLGLAHTQSKKTIELKEKGTFKASDLETKLNSSSSSLASKYSGYVVSELTAKGSGIERKSETGSVHRGTVDLTAPIQMMLDEQTEVLDSKVMVKWYLNASVNTADVEAFVVDVKDMMGVTVFTQELKDTYVVLDLTDPKFNEGVQSEAFNITVSSKGKLRYTTQPHYLRRMDEDKKKEVEKEYKSLKAELGESAISDLVLAQFFEEKGLLTNAITCYENALKSADVSEYKNVYSSFLDRNYLSLAAREELRKKRNR